MKRTLTLKKESLSELTTSELDSVVGGTTGVTPITRTCTPIVSYVPCYVVTVVVQTVIDGCLP